MFQDVATMQWLARNRAPKSAPYRKYPSTDRDRKVSSYLCLYCVFVQVDRWFDRFMLQYCDHVYKNVRVCSSRFRLQEWDKQFFLQDTDFEVCTYVRLETIIAFQDLSNDFPINIINMKNRRISRNNLKDLRSLKKIEIYYLLWHRVHQQYPVW